MTVMVFYDTPSAKCDVYSVPKGKLKILRMLWKQDRCKNQSNRGSKRGSEGESERAKDKTGDTHLRGIQTRRPRLARVFDKQGEKKTKLTNNEVDFAQTDNTPQCLFHPPFLVSSLPLLAKHD